MNTDTALEKLVSWSDLKEKLPRCVDGKESKLLFGTNMT